MRAQKGAHRLPPPSAGLSGRQRRMLNTHDMYPPAWGPVWHVEGWAGWSSYLTTTNPFSRSWDPRCSLDQYLIGRGAGCGSLSHGHHHATLALRCGARAGLRRGYRSLYDHHHQVTRQRPSLPRDTFPFSLDSLAHTELYVLSGTSAGPTLSRSYRWRRRQQHRRSRQRCRSYSSR